MNVPPDLVEAVNRDIFGRVEQIAGFQVPEQTQAKFDALNRASGASPRLLVLQRLTVEGGSRRDWLRQFITAALHNVPEALAATYYHLLSIEGIENEVCSFVRSAIRELNIPKNLVAGGGNTRRITFEYEAFLFDIRRTLEYFAAAVGAFFKTDCIRIRDICNAIGSSEPAVIREPVVRVIERSVTGLCDLLPPDTRGARDVVAHWRPLRAGTFNVSGQFFGFFEGPELGPWDSRTSARSVHKREGDIVVGVISPPLREQLGIAEEMIFGVYKEMGLLP